MLIPKKVKHRKHHRGNSSGKSMSGNYLAFGSFGLKALENSWITARQIEAARRAMTRYIQRGGKVWIRIFPDKPITSHGNESPMGSGKGAVDHFVAVVEDDGLAGCDGALRFVEGDADAVATTLYPSL